MQSSQYIRIHQPIQQAAPQNVTGELPQALSVLPGWEKGSALDNHLEETLALINKSLGVDFNGSWI